MKFASVIEKQTLMDLPLGAFEGEIIIVEDSRDVSEATEFLSKFDILGFDTETRPSFRKGQNPPVALLQLATEDYAFLFRLNKINFPDELVALLSNEQVTKVGIGIQDDLRALNHLREFQESGFIELQSFAKNYGIEGISLRKLAGIVLNMRVSKSKQLSNWEADLLDEKQQLYAATDAWVAYKVYTTLLLSR